MSHSIYTRAPGANAFTTPAFHTNATLNGAFDAKVSEARGRMAKGEFVDVVVLDDDATNAAARYVFLPPLHMGREEA